MYKAHLKAQRNMVKSFCLVQHRYLFHRRTGALFMYTGISFPLEDWSSLYYTFLLDLLRLAGSRRAERLSSDIRHERALKA
jgi:hypothetical protein